MPLTRILFPVDFSPNCEQAAHFVRFFSERFGSEILMLHVMPPAEHLVSMLEIDGGESDDVRRGLADRCHQRLERFLADQFPTAQRILLEGEPGMEIARFAELQKIGLIVMPTHGFSLMRRFVLGSVTARVLHDAHCAVFTGLPNATFHGVKSVLCAIDLREQSAQTLAFAQALAAPIQATLTVVHASPAVSTPSVSAFDGDLTTRLAAEARERIGQWLGEQKIQAQVCVHPGDPAEVIRRAEQEHHADLLVLGRGAVTGGLGRLRAHSYSIINQTLCPVISV